MVAQHLALTFPLSAARMVGPGRLPWREQDAASTAATGRALLRAGIGPDLAAQDWATLSGGERQCVQLAQALALRLLRELASDDGLAIVIVLHDLNQAAFVADRVIRRGGARQET